MTNIQKFLTLIVTIIFITLYTQIVEAQENTIAVSDFNNLTGNSELNYLSKGLSASFITNLGKNKGLVIVERERFESILREMGLSQSGLIDLSTAAKVGKAIGASKIVLGELVKAGVNLRLNVRLIETETAKVLFAFSKDANSENEILNLVDTASREISASLNNIPIENYKNLFWFGLNGGVFYPFNDESFRATCFISYNFDKTHLFSLRTYSDLKFETNIGLLYGRTFRNDSNFFTASTGLAVDINSYGVNFGLPLQAQFIFPFSENIGFNFQADTYISTSNLGLILSAGVILGSIK